MGKEVVFKDVFLFIERLKDTARWKGDDLVRRNAWLCLRGAAAIWWDSVVSDTEKRLMETGGQGVVEWETFLISRWADSLSDAMSRIITSTYTMHDALLRKDPREFATEILRMAKAACINRTYNQLTLCYGQFDIELRRDLTAPSQTITPAAFLEMLDGKRKIWFELAQRQNQSRESQRYNQRQPLGRLPNYNQGYGRRPPYQQFGYQLDGPPAYGNRQPNPRVSYFPAASQPYLAANPQNNAYYVPKQNFNQQAEQRGVTLPARLQITMGENDAKQSGSTSLRQGGPNQPNYQQGRDQGQQTRQDRNYPGRGGFSNNRGGRGRGFGNQAGRQN